MNNEIFDRPAGRTLSEIVESMIDTETAIFNNEGEITPELEAFMASDERDLAAKIDGYNAAYREEAARAEALKAEIARLQALKKTAENSAKRIKDMLRYNMERLGAERVSGNTCKAYFTSSVAVETNEAALLKPYEAALAAARAALPAWVSVDVGILKNELSAELKAGRILEGAALIRSRSVVLK